MNKIFWFCLYLFPLFSLRGEDNTIPLSQQAEALWEARDYDSASKIYEQLQSPSLPDWQQARLFYNLGTIQLSQHHPLEALDFFHKISPFQLSLPTFGRHLFLNEGIAYLQYAEILAADNSPLDQQILYMEQSLRAFEQARMLECQIQKKEQKEDGPFSCETSYLLDQWTKNTRSKLDAAYRQKNQNWIEQSDATSFQENQELQKAMFNYQILLLQEILPINSLKNLLGEFEALKAGNDQSPSLDAIKNNLRLSLEELQNQHSIQARFFLLAGFGQAEALFQPKIKSPASILQQGIDQANRAWQLFFLSEMMSKESSQQTSVYKILEEQQQEILTQVAPFIPNVIKTQEKLFSQATDANVGCQQSPWDQVIPLYDRGYRAMQKVIKKFDKTRVDAQMSMAQQEQTIKEWQHAQKLILHPPQQHPAGSSSQKLTETVRLLQDMYLQDQFQPEQSTEEVHSW